MRMHWQKLSTLLVVVVGAGTLHAVTPSAGPAAATSTAARAGIQVAQAPLAAEGSYYRPIEPVRLLHATGPSANELGPGGTASVRVSGVGGVPADGVSAVLVNLTGSRSTRSTTITITGAGMPAPATANLTLPPLLAADNLAIVPVGPDGLVTIRNVAGRVNVGLDLMGWFPVQSDLVTVAPSRLVDTRNGSAPDAPVRSGSPLAVAVTDRAGVPASGVGMVIANVTALDATALTSLKLYASGSPAPAVPNMDVFPLLPAVNLAFIPVGANGAISVANTFGRVNVIVDILGWLPSTTDVHLVAPQALLDTPPQRWTGRIGTDASLDVQVSGRAGIPSTRVAAVILSVSGSGASRETAITVHPSDGARPETSSVQVPPLLPAENLVVVPLGSDGKVRVHNANGSVRVAVDVYGWFSEEPPPTDGSWEFQPDSLILTSPGESAMVELVHRDVTGRLTGAPPPSGIVTAARGDAASVGLADIGRGRYRLTASDQVGYAEIDATVPGIEAPATVRVSNLRLRDGVAVVGEDRIVVPAPDGSTAISGPFTVDEIRSRVVAPPSDGDPFDDDIRLPVVLRGDALATGTVVIRADGLAFAGRVVEPAGHPTLVRAGHSLMSLAIVSPFEVFREVSTATSGPAPSPVTSGPAAGMASVQALTSEPGASFRSLAQPALDCEAESASKAVELTAGITQFNPPHATFDMNANPDAGNAAVTLGIEGDITVELDLSLQLAQEVTFECTLAELPTLDIAPPGPGAVLSAYFSPSIKLGIEVKGTVGPRVSMGLTCSQHFGYEVEITYDSQLGLHDRPRNLTTPAECTPTFDVTADVNAVTIEANAGVFAVAAVGVRAGGAFAAWAERVGLAEDLGQVQLLELKAGPRLHAVWENDAKVLASEDTESTFGLELLIEGAIDAEIPGLEGVGPLDRLAQWISDDPNAKAEIKFLDVPLPGLTFYRPPAPRPGSLETRVNGALQASGQVVEVAPGDRVAVRAVVEPKGPTALLLGDAPVTGASAHRQSGLGTMPFDALTLEVLEQGGGSTLVHGTLDILPALCDELGGSALTIQLLADAPMFGLLPTSGYAGKFSLRCAGPRLEFDRTSVDFLAHEVGFPATVGLTGFELNGWDWTLTGLQSWLRAVPSSGVFDSEEEREPIVLTVDCSAVNPPAVVSHIVVATASAPGQEPREARLPVSADCRRRSEIDVPGQVVLDPWQVVGLPNDPNRCITVQFLEFPAIADATSYTAVVLNHVLGVNQTFTAAPPWPADSYTVTVTTQIQHTFLAIPFTHRMVLGSDSSGRGCTTPPRFTLVSLKARIG